MEEDIFNINHGGPNVEPGEMLKSLDDYRRQSLVVLDKKLEDIYYTYLECGLSKKEILFKFIGVLNV